MGRTPMDTFISLLSTLSVQFSVSQLTREPGWHLSSWEYVYHQSREDEACTTYWNTNSWIWKGTPFLCNRSEDGPCCWCSCAGSGESRAASTSRSCVTGNLYWMTWMRLFS